MPGSRGTGGGAGLGCGGREPAVWPGLGRGVAGGGGPGRSHSWGDPERTLVLLHHVLHLVWPIHPPDESSQAADKISLGFLNSIPKHSPPAMCWLAAG